MRSSIFWCLKLGTVAKVKLSKEDQKEIEKKEDPDNEGDGMEEDYTLCHTTTAANRYMLELENKILDLQYERGKYLQKRKESECNRVYGKALVSVDISIPPPAPPPFFQTCFIVIVMYLLLYLKTTQNKSFFLTQ